MHACMYVCISAGEPAPGGGLASPRPPASGAGGGSGSGGKGRSAAPRAEDALGTLFLFSC